MAFDFKKLKSNTLAGVFLHLLLAGATFVLLAVVYFYVYLPRSTNHGETITVPNIEGKSIDELEEFLARKSLRYEIGDSTYSEDFDPLTVIKQYPHAGAKVKEGRKIFVSVNRKEPPSVPVPNLIDGSVINAEAVLKSNQLRRGKIELVPGPFNVVKEMRFKGKVIQPQARVPKGSVIDLVVMMGDDTVPMPDLINEEFDDAKAHILGLSLIVGKVNLIGDTLRAKPVVLRQIPQEGTDLKAGDIVELWIGPAGTEVQNNNEPEED